MFVLPIVGFSQSEIKTKFGTFDYYNGVRYRAIFNQDMDIESQTIKIKANITGIGYPVRSASMKVEKKDGRTRVTVTNFSIGDVESSGAVLVGNVIVGDDDTEYYQPDNVTWNDRKQSFRRSFVNRYSFQLEETIINAIKRMKDSNKNDDW